MWQTGSESYSSDQQQGTEACRKEARRQAVYDRGLEKGKAIKVTTNFLQQNLDMHFLNALVSSVEIPGRRRELDQQWSHDI